jgi:hypothetical protein
MRHKLSYRKKGLVKSRRTKSRKNRKSLVKSRRTKSRKNRKSLVKSKKYSLKTHKKTNSKGQVGGEPPVELIPLKLNTKTQGNLFGMEFDQLPGDVTIAKFTAEVDQGGKTYKSVLGGIKNILAPKGKSRSMEDAARSVFHLSNLLSGDKARFISIISPILDDRVIVNVQAMGLVPCGLVHWLNSRPSDDQKKWKEYFKVLSVTVSDYSDILIRYASIMNPLTMSRLGFYISAVESAVPTALHALPVVGSVVAATSEKIMSVAHSWIHYLEHSTKHLRRIIGIYINNLRIINSEFEFENQDISGFDVITSDNKNDSLDILQRHTNTLLEESGTYIEEQGKRIWEERMKVYKQQPDLIKTLRRGGEGGPYQTAGEIIPEQALFMASSAWKYGPAPPISSAQSDDTKTRRMASTDPSEDRTWVSDVESALQGISDKLDDKTRNALDVWWLDIKKGKEETSSSEENTRNHRLLDSYIKQIKEAMEGIDTEGIDQRYREKVEADLKTKQLREGEINLNEGDTIKYLGIEYRIISGVVLKGKDSDRMFNCKVSPLEGDTSNHIKFNISVKDVDIIADPVKIDEGIKSLIVAVQDKVLKELQNRGENGLIDTTSNGVLKAKYEEQMRSPPERLSDPDAWVKIQEGKKTTSNEDTRSPGAASGVVSAQQVPSAPQPVEVVPVATHVASAPPAEVVPVMAAPVVEASAPPGEVVMPSQAPSQVAVSNEITYENPATVN